MKDFEDILKKLSELINNTKDEKVIESLKGLKKDIKVLKNIIDEGLAAIDEYEDGDVIGQQKYDLMELISPTYYIEHHGFNFKN